MRLSEFVLGALSLASSVGLARGQVSDPYPASGVSLLGQILPDELDPAMVWTTKVKGYAAPSGREYALLGTRNGVCFLEVTDPGAPVLLKVVATHYAFYRTLATYGEYAYVGNSTNGAIRIFDLSQIDAGIVTLVDTYDAGPTTTHNLAIDLVSATLFRFGFEGGPGFLSYSLADPIHPVLTGQWVPSIQDGMPITYTSGPFAGREVVFACNLTPTDSLRLIDVTDKANPFQISEVFYPNPGLSHQVSVSEDRRWAFFNDEFDELYLGQPTTTHVFDVQDIFAPVLAASFTNGTTGVTHDNFVLNGLLFCANYTTGLRVFDVSDPLAAFETAWFDIWPCNDEANLHGLFSVDPYLPSGTVLGAGTEDGLFVWRLGEPGLVFSYPQSLPDPFQPVGQTITVDIVENSPDKLSKGTAMLHFDDGTGPQSVPLVPLVPGGSEYVATLPQLACGGLVRYYVSGKSSEGVTWTDPPAATTRQDRYVAGVGLARIPLFEDDFEQAKGWVSQSQNPISGAWQRADPNGTPYAPEDDYSVQGDKCWVTENAAPSCDFLQAEVSGGPYTLVSPLLDLSGAIDPHVEYARWFANDGLPVRDDVFAVEVTDDGIAWVRVETVGPHPPWTSGGWVRQQFRLLDYVSASASVRVRFIATDDLNNSVVEAAVDDFLVFEPVCQGPQNYCTAGTSASGCQALITWSGTPSASAGSGFLLIVPELEGDKDGLFFFGANGRMAAPWGNGTSYNCVAPPSKRAGLQTGTGTQGECDGFFSQDMNAHWKNTPARNPGAGALVQAQLWYRDPFNTSNQPSSFSDALEFFLLP